MHRDNQASRGRWIDRAVVLICSDPKTGTKKSFRSKKETHTVHGCNQHDECNPTTRFSFQCKQRKGLPFHTNALMHTDRHIQAKSCSSMLQNKQKGRHPFLKLCCGKNPCGLACSSPLLFPFLFVHARRHCMLQRAFPFLPTKHNTRTQIQRALHQPPSHLILCTRQTNEGPSSSIKKDDTNKRSRV